MRAAVPNRWIGSIESSGDHFTFYLLVQKRPDGTLSALLDNPEVDWAARLKVESIAREGNAVRLLGRAGLEATIQMLVDRPMESIDTPVVDALLIARKGKLVLEEYFRGQDRETLHALRSAQKSMVCVLAGAVMESGGPLRLSSPVYSVMNGGTFPPQLDPRRRAMTLEHLLTMTSDLSCDDWDDQSPYNEDAMWDNQDKEPDFYRYALDLPMARNPGEKAFYCSAGANLALGVAARATNEPAVELFDRLVARPMGIDRYTWPFNRGGQPYGAGGASFRARDFLKFGQLMLDGGTWQGRRILSREFVQRSTSPLYPLAAFTSGTCGGSTTIRTRAAPSAHFGREATVDRP
jgi:CubicO group peptidase (beta-lactamase class C family)